jgi:hypothetical protein
MPHKKGHKKTMKRKSVKKGGYYGASGAIAPGAMEWKAGSEMGDFAISSRGGNTQYGARRHKKSKKSMKKTHKMRGGSKFGAVSASYQGQGSRGLADYAQITTKYPSGGPAAGGAFNNFGAQPGSGYGSFVRI